MGTSLSNRNPLRVAQSLLRHLEAQGVIRPQIPPQEDYEGRQEWEAEFLTKNGRAATERDWYDFTREPADISEIDAEPEAQRTAQLSGDDGEQLESRARAEYHQTDSVDSSEYLFTDGTGIAIDNDHRIISSVFTQGIPKGYLQNKGSSSGYMLAFMGETGACRVRRSSDCLAVSFVTPPTRAQIRAILKTSGHEVYIDQFGPNYDRIRSGKFWMPDEAGELESFLLGESSFDESQRFAQAGPWSQDTLRPIPDDFDPDGPCGRAPHHTWTTTYQGDSNFATPASRVCSTCRVRHLYHNGRWYYDNPRFCQQRQASKSLKMPLKSLVSEHTKLVQVLKRDDPKEIAKEAKDQGAELKEYKKQARLSSPSIEKRVAIALLDHLERKGQAGPWNADRPKWTNKKVIDKLADMGLIVFKNPSASTRLWKSVDPDQIVPHSEWIVDLLNNTYTLIYWKSGTMPHIQDVVTGFGLPEYVEPNRRGQAGPWNAEPKGDIQLKCYGKGEEVAFRYPKNIEEMCSYCDQNSHIWVQSLSGDARKVKVNGRVRRWKTDPTRIEIPVKYGLRECWTMTARDRERVLIPVGNKYIGQAGPWNANRPKPMAGDAKHDAWIEKYRPIKNTIDTNANMDGTMFETFGPELDFVRAQDPHKIWTLLDADNHQVIAAGYHFVDRVGYFITALPWSDETESIDLDEGRPQCPECGEFTDDFTHSDDCSHYNQQPPQPRAGIRLSNRSAQSGPWNNSRTDKGVRRCEDCGEPLTGGPQANGEGYYCWDCIKRSDKHDESEAEWYDAFRARQAQAGPWNKESSGSTQERWVFTDGELKFPRLCKRSDEFEAAMPDTDFRVIVNRAGTCQNQWHDGTRGVSSYYAEVAESQDILFSVEHRADAETWRTVICDQDGKFVRFVDDGA